MADELDLTGTDIDDLGDAGQDDSGTTEDDLTAEGQQASDDQDAAGSQEDDGSDEAAGLKAAAAAERQKRQAAEAERDALRAQVQAGGATKPGAAQQPQVQPTAADILRSMGIEVEDDDDLMTAGQMVKALGVVLGQVQNIVHSTTFSTQHPDFEKVVGVREPDGSLKKENYAPPLQRAIKANPVLDEVLKQSPNWDVLAYAIAKNDPQYLAEKSGKSGKTAEQIAADKAAAKLKGASKKQLSVSAAKGGGQLDTAAAITAMSDEEFAAHNQKIMDKAL